MYSATAAGASLRESSARVLADLVGAGLDRERASDYLSYLESALTTDRPALFQEYVGWLGTMEGSRGQPLGAIRSDVDALRRIVESQLEPGVRDACSEVIRAALAGLGTDPTRAVSFLRDGAAHVELAREYLQLVFAAQRREASARIHEAVEAGLSIPELYLDVFQPVQWEVGRLWQLNEIGVGQEHFCTALTQAIMAQFYSTIFATPRTGLRVVAANVSGNLHELGVRMVADFLELEGFDTYYLGADAPLEAVLAAAEERRPQVLAVSAALGSHLPRVRELAVALRARTSLESVKLLVGGLAIRPDDAHWRELGGDDYAEDARSAVEAVRRLAAA